MSSGHRGLSIVEMVIVLGLIAVMMALSLPMLSNANAEARATVCRQNLADIGNAITGYTRDFGVLPSIAELPPHHPGMSLPELVAQRLQTPSVVFCPSDETERSQLLGTSYRWAAAYNGMKYKDLRRAVDKPLLTDRDTFHAGSDLASNELLLKRTESSYQFVVTSGAGAKFEDPSPIDDAEDQQGVPLPNAHSLHAKRMKAKAHDKIRRGVNREYR